MSLGWACMDCGTTIFERWRRRYDIHISNFFPKYILEATAHLIFTTKSGFNSRLRNANSGASYGGSWSARKQLPKPNDKPKSVRQRQTSESSVRVQVIRWDPKHVGVPVNLDSEEPRQLEGVRLHPVTWYNISQWQVNDQTGLTNTALSVWIVQSGNTPWTITSARNLWTGAAVPLGGYNHRLSFREKSPELPYHPLHRCHNYYQLVLN